jgi:hypothetical protein
VSDRKLCLSWPRDVYSLAHIALATPPHDSLYGGEPGATAQPGIQLGKLAQRGEYGILKVSAADMLRMRWNPFYPYTEHRIMQFLSLPSHWQPPCTDLMGAQSGGKEERE